MKSSSSPSLKTVSVAARASQSRVVASTSQAVAEPPKLVAPRTVKSTKSNSTPSDSIAKSPASVADSPLVEKKKPLQQACGTLKANSASADTMSKSDAKPVVAPKVRAATLKNASSAIETSQSKSPQAKRKRVPRDLARQYGESESRRKPAANEDSATTRRGRRDAETRERRHRVMLPDEQFLQRLARAGAIANSTANGAMGIEVEEKVARRTSTTRAPRHWSADCGKCRWSGDLKTAAALCPRCGTIILRP